MEFDFFQQQLEPLSSLPTNPLAHRLAMPPQRDRWIAQALQNPDPPKQAAVLCCFYPDEKGQTRFVLIRRQASKYAHGGQYALPGGKQEALDRSHWETALREAEEEVNIQSEAVHYIRGLHDLYIPPSHFQVHPFLGYLEQAPHLKPQPSEVAEIYSIPIESLLNPNNLIQTSMTTSYMKNQFVPAFNLGGHLVWGATAMMLAELRELLRSLAG
ncbi:MAG: NUDIX hydrolase [Flavobacteriaceae bacterium]